MGIPIVLILLVAVSNVFGSVVIQGSEKEIHHKAPAQEKRIFWGPVIRWVTKLVPKVAKVASKAVAAAKPVSSKLIQGAKEVGHHLGKEALADVVIDQIQDKLDSKRERKDAYFCVINCAPSNQPICVTNGTKKISFANACEFRKAMQCCANFGGRTKSNTWRLQGHGMCPTNIHHRREVISQDHC